MKLKKLIALMLSLIIITCTLDISSYADSGNGTQGGNSGYSQTGRGSSIVWNYQGYRVYMTSGSESTGTLQVASPVEDIVFADIPDNTGELFSTLVGDAKVSVGPLPYSWQSNLYIDPMPMPLNITGNQYIPQGDALKNWFLNDYSGDYNNISIFIYANFGIDMLKQYRDQKVRMVVESVVWFMPADRSGNSAGYWVYGNVKNIAGFLDTNYGDWGYSPSFSNKALPFSLTLQGDDYNLGLSAPTSDQFSDRQTNAALLYGNEGFGIHDYWDTDQQSPSPSIPDTTSSVITPPKPGLSDGGSNDIPKQPNDSTVPPNPSTPPGSNNIITHYASASYTTSGSATDGGSLDLESTQWSMNARAVYGSDGWQGINQVLPGGAIYTLSTPGANVTLKTWQGYNVGGTDAAVYYHRLLVAEAENALDNWNIAQYVTSNVNAGSAFSGIEVKSGGMRLSGLNDNYTSSDDKYYLRDGTSDNWANEADLDILGAATGYAYYDIAPTTDGWKLYRSYNGGGWTEIPLDGSEAATLNAMTNIITYATSEQIEAGALYGISTINVGLSNPEIRSAALDPSLCPTKDSENDLFRSAFLSQFGLEPRSTAYSTMPTGYLGSFHDTQICLSDPVEMLASKKFYIPDANVQDLD